jgi:hypothetical protein
MLNGFASDTGKASSLPAESSGRVEILKVASFVIRPA